MEWQPIETAPKDGTEFQAWVDQIADVKSHWNNRNGWWEPHCRYDEDGNFQIYGRVDYDIEEFETRYDLKPTRWMPYPEPPK